MQGVLRSLAPPLLRNVLRHGVFSDEIRSDIRRDLGDDGRIGRRTGAMGIAVAVMTLQRRHGSSRKLGEGPSVVSEDYKQKVLQAIQDGAGELSAEDHRYVSANWAVFTEFVRIATDMGLLGP